MPGKDKKRQEKITCDALRQTVQQAFDRIRDPRRANVSYALTDLRGSAFARFWLKRPSLRSFDERTKAEDRNVTRDVDRQIEYRIVRGNRHDPLVRRAVGDLRARQRVRDGTVCSRSPLGDLMSFSAGLPSIQYAHS